MSDLEKLGGLEAAESARDLYASKKVGAYEFAKWMEAIIARVKELERERLVAVSEASDKRRIAIDLRKERNALDAKLQSARQLAEMVDTVIYSGIGNENIHITAPDARKLKAKAREVLEKIK